MKRLLLSMALFISLSVFAQAPAENYPVDSASVEHSAVPRGEVLKFVFDHSTIFPGTWREYWVYIPKQYKPDKPACLYVNQDGIQYKAPTVFDNLINAGEMPVTIGVFINPGIVRSKDTAHALDRYNRSFEYDGLGKNYVRFLLDEILPEVEKQKTSDGRTINLSKNANDRAIGGSSSGAVCAFTAAWERPDAFSRVFSSIGTYISLRGADRYPGLIRKYEPKALRVFLQDGTNDLNIYAGDWWKANETMERALTFSGYEIQHVWGEGSHNGVQATAIFPQAMRWLWKDYPRAVQAGQSKNQMLSDLLIRNEGWSQDAEGYSFTEGIIADSTGDIFFQDIPASKTYKISGSAKPILLPVDGKKASGTAYDARGNRVTAGGCRQVISYDRNGKAKVLASDISGNDLVVARNGNIYVTDPDGTDKPSKIWLITPDGKKTVVDEGLHFANGLALSPDQTQLYVAESASHWLWAYSIGADGKLDAKQRFGWLHGSDESEFAWPDGVKCDTSGRIYVASSIGIQVLDQTGRVNAIIAVPDKSPSNLCFGGKNFDVLYITCVDKVFHRKLHTRGVNTFDPSVKPVKPRL